MADLIETPGWEAGIYQLETTDPVEGGAAGVDNVQARQLANRTAYLKQLVETLGTGKQPIDAMLTALAALVTAADKTLYFTGADAPALTTLTAYMRTALAAVDAAAARTVLGAASPADIATAIANLVASSPAALDTLNELAAALGDDPNFATTITTALAAKAPLASPALTGMPTAPTADPATATTQLATTAFVDAAIAAALATAPGMSTGTVFMVPGTAAPAGSTEIDGRLVSRTTFAGLWAYAQTSGNLAASDAAWTAGQFSPGDGATTFRLPDGRGEFFRGLDNGRGVDAGRAIGSSQADDLKSHTHTVPIANGGPGASNASGYYTTAANTATSATGGTETRPRNIAWLACIRC